MDAAPALAATSLPGPPPGLLLDRQRPCACCTYDLFRQPLDGKCPECGVDVAVSLQTRYLRDGGPAYLRALRQGANLIVTFVVVGLVGLGAALVGTYLLALPGSWRTSIMFQVLLDLGFLAATWRLTVADPGRPRPARRWATRGAVLTMTVAQVGLVAYVIADRVDPSAGITLPEAQRLWAMFVTITTLEAIGVLAFGFTVAGLSQRLPAPGLARGLRAVSIGFFLALLAALAAVTLCLAMLHGHVSNETALRVSRLLAWPQNAGRVVFGVAAAVLLWAFARQLRAEAAEGQG